MYYHVGIPLICSGWYIPPIFRFTAPPPSFIQLSQRSQYLGGNTMFMVGGGNANPFDRITAGGGGGGGGGGRSSGGGGFGFGGGLSFLLWRWSLCTCCCVYILVSPPHSVLLSALCLPSTLCLLSAIFLILHPPSCVPTPCIYPPISFVAMVPDALHWHCMIFMFLM
jgi:hypothetical protein